MCVDARKNNRHVCEAKDMNTRTCGQSQLPLWLVVLPVGLVDAAETKLSIDAADEVLSGVSLRPTTRSLIALRGVVIRVEWLDELCQNQSSGSVTQPTPLCAGGVRPCVQLPLFPT